MTTGDGGQAARPPEDSTSESITEIAEVSLGFRV